MVLFECEGGGFVLLAFSLEYELCSEVGFRGGCILFVLDGGLGCNGGGSGFFVSSCMWCTTCGIGLRFYVHNADITVVGLDEG